MDSRELSYEVEDLWRTIDEYKQARSDILRSSTRSKVSSPRRTSPTRGRDVSPYASPRALTPRATSPTAVRRSPSPTFSSSLMRKLQLEEEITLRSLERARTRKELVDAMNSRIVDVLDRQLPDVIGELNRRKGDDSYVLRMKENLIGEERERSRQQQEKIKNLQIQMQELEDTAMKLREELRLKTDRVEQLTENNTRLVRSLRMEEEARGISQDQVKRLMEEMAGLSEKNLSLSRSLEHSERSHIDDNSESQLHEAIIAERLQETRNDLDRKTSEAAHLRKEVDTLRQNAILQEETIQKLRETSEATISAEVRRRSDVERELTSVRAETLDVSEDRDETERRAASLRRELQRREHEIASKEEEIAYLKEKNSLLLTTVEAHEERKMKDMEVLRQKDEQLNRMHGERAELANKLDNREVQAGRLEETLKADETRLRELNQELAGLRVRADEDRHVATQEMQLLNEKLRLMESQLEKELTNKQKLDEANRLLEEEMAVTKEKNSLLQVTLQTLREENERAHSQVLSKEDEANGLRIQRKKEMEKESERYEAKSKENELLHEKCMFLNQSLSNTQDQKNQVQGALRDVQTELADLKEQAWSDGQKDKATIQNLESQLRLTKEKNSLLMVSTEKEIEKRNLAEEELSSKNSHLQGLQEECSRLQKWVSEAEDLRKKLQADLSNREGELQTLEEKCRTLEEKVNHTQHFNDSLNEAIRQKEANEKELEEKIVKTTRGFEEDLMHRDNEIRTMERNLQDVGQRLEQVTTDRNSLREQLHHVELQLQNEKSTGQRLESELSMTSKELEAQRREGSDTMLRLEKEMESSKRTLDDLRAAEEAVGRLDSELQTTQSHLRAREEALSKTEEERRMLDERCTALQNDVSHFSANFRATDQQLSATKEDLAKKEEANENLYQENLTILRKNHELELEGSKFQHQLQSSETRCAELEAKNQRMSEDWEKQRNVWENEKQMMAANFDSDMFKKDEELRQSHTRGSELLERVTVEEGEKTHLQGQVNNLTEELRLLRNDYENARRQATLEEESRVRVEGEMAKRDEQINGLLSENMNMMQRLRELEASNSNAKADLESRDVQIREMKGRIGHLLGKLATSEDTLANEHSQLVEKDNTSRVLDEKLRREEESRLMLEEEVKRKNHEILVLSENNAHLERALQNEERAKNALRDNLMICERLHGPRASPKH